MLEGVTSLGRWEGESQCPVSDDLADTLIPSPGRLSSARIQFQMEIHSHHCSSVLRSQKENTRHLSRLSGAK